MFLFWKKLKKVRGLAILRGKVVAGFNFACSAGELQKGHVIIQQLSNVYLTINYLFIYFSCSTAEH